MGRKEQEKREDDSPKNIDMSYGIQRESAHLLCRWITKLLCNKTMSNFMKGDCNENRQRGENQFSDN
jgi:hypothetical protein